MEQSTLEAISITALVISIIVFVVLVFNMLKGLFTHGGIVKMKGGNSVAEQLRSIKEDIDRISEEYEPGTPEYHNNIVACIRTHRYLVLILYVIFTVKLVESTDPSVRDVATKMFEMCKNDLPTAEPLVARTKEMLEDSARRPIPVREVYELDNEWFHALKLPRDPCAREVVLE